MENEKKIENEEVRENNDYILDTLNRIVSTADIELGITVSVNGALITGSLIGFSKYTAELSEAYREAGENALAEALANFFEESNKQHKEHLEEEAEEEYTPYHYIHLKDAKFVFGGSMVPTNQGTYWRGKVESVDGFSIGKLSASPQI